MGGNHVDDIIIISSDEDEELSSSVSPFCRVSLFQKFFIKQNRNCARLIGILWIISLHWHWLLFIWQWFPYLLLLYRRLQTCF